jgi:TRAP-type transport system periplasmic protein
MPNFAKHAKQLSTAIVLLVIIASLLFISSCSSQSPSSAPASSNAQAAQPTFKLTYSFWGTPKESMARVAEKYIAEIKAKTNGRVDITYYTGGSLTGPTVAYDGVVKGLSSMAMVFMGYTPGRFPLTQAWSLPLGIPTSQAGTQIYMNSYKKFMPAELQDTKVMYVFCTSPSQLLTKKEIKSLDDLKGMKVRTAGITADYFTLLGATPVSMPVGDIYDGLQKGIIDCTNNAPGVLTDFKLEDIIKYLYMWNLPTGSIALVMNNDVWKSLPADIQKVFEEANAKYVEQEPIEWNVNDDNAIKAATAKGLQVKSLTPELQKQFKERAQPLYDKYIADTSTKGPAKEFLDYCLSLVK